MLSSAALPTASGPPTGSWKSSQTGRAVRKRSKRSGPVLDAMIDGHKHLAETARRCAASGLRKSMASLCAKTAWSRAVPPLVVAGSGGGLCGDGMPAPTVFFEKNHGGGRLRLCGDRLPCAKSWAWTFHRSSGCPENRRQALRRFGALRFSIHDFVGGRGADPGLLRFLASWTKCATAHRREEADFRQDAYDRFYDGEKSRARAEESRGGEDARSAPPPSLLQRCAACARIHLPVAPSATPVNTACGNSTASTKRPGVTPGSFRRGAAKVLWIKSRCQTCV